ncbi:transmembrane and coiled-coil domain-containing protein 4-like isoform X1 [Patiria miniata]|uniref:Transmembrane and coiled-coil domain-containing protein 4 n=1 Tax=Patiria miniata TaxID=46514 RepID=A0A914AD87_PATMI|nr:transmembrane and coiled-coil domain-containing protein 4-like isoform X1 [Patiria miniata]XP_038061309.1 transmembrane and coiled-coil domain-containing protein 4-like isoform X1 [Patiria miniata]
MDGLAGCADSRGIVQDSTSTHSHSTRVVADEDSVHVHSQDDSETQDEQQNATTNKNCAVSSSSNPLFDTNANKSVTVYREKDMSSHEVNLDTWNKQTKTTGLNSEHHSMSSSSCAYGETSMSCAHSSGGQVGESDGSAQSVLVLEKPLNEALNDAGHFSYVTLCSVNLSILFEDQWNKDWKERTVRSLVKHMNLPKKVVDTMLMFMSTPHDKEDAMIFADSLREDPSLVKPQLVPQDLIGHALADGQYDARSRVLALHVASLMGVQETEIHDFEATIVNSFIQEEVELSEEEQKEKQKRAKMKKVKRFAMIGAAAVGGGALIGLTGGLAAPLIASAGAALLGGSIGFLGTAAGVAVMASVFGAAGAGLTGFKMKKRVGAIEEFEFECISEEKDLHVTIAVSGWLTKDTMTYEDVLYNNFSVPWLTLESSKEVYCLHWESKYLLALGEALSLILNKMVTMAAKEALKMTVLAGLVVAFALPAAAYSSLVAIDNPWSIVTNRAAEGGKQLAEVLLSRRQGKRPVTLIGFSMGARVIFFCLKELVNRKGCEGIVQDAVLLGAPVPSTVKYWKPFVRVVAGKIINGFCRGDWLLQFIYRAASVQMIDIAGLEPIAWKDRRMVNVDLTEIVNGHFDYVEKMDEILNHIGLRTRATCISRNLTQRTRTPTGPFDSDQCASSSGSIDDREIDYAIIDAKDLILSAENPPMAQANIPHCDLKLVVTGHNQPEPLQVGASHTEQKACLVSTSKSDEAQLSKETIGEAVARLEECSIRSEGTASLEHGQDVELGEKPAS